jgi:YVTN family beta-propeller protein
MRLCTGILLWRPFAFLSLIPLLPGQTVERPVRAVTDPGVVTTRQSITPAGVPTIFQGRVYGVSFGASASELWVLHASHVYRLDWRANRVLDRISHNGSPGLQGIRYDIATNRALISGAAKDRKTRLLGTRGSSLETLLEGEGTQIAGALAVAAGKRAVVPLIFDNKLAIVELESARRARSVPTEIAPFGAAVNEAGSVAWVSHWGGRRPNAKDLTAPTGLAPTADRVVVDARGIAASGTVMRIDLTGSQSSVSVAVGLHPTALAWDEKQDRLYVANSNSDSISVVDTRTNRLLRNIEVQPFSGRVAGIAPTALVLSGDGETLWTACGGINAVAQISTRDGRIAGLIPTGWYPNALSLAPGGRYLAVSTLLGPGSGWRDEPRKRFVHSYRGSVHVIERPDAAQLASYTTAVAENNHLTVGPAAPQPVPARARKPLPVPERTGDPSLIEHVVYIIKENRTYDQVFGDMPKGNGDPSLVMFGENITPNQHRLAGRYVLLDNFYASGGNSADGHQWLTQANEVSYCLWPGYTGRSYPFDGSDPIAHSARGFLWDLALARNRSVRIYGEYAGRMNEANADQRLGLLKEWEAGADFGKRWSTRAPIDSLNKILAANYPAYTNAIPDVVRASIFKADVERWVKAGSMPNLVIVQLPSDHTYGTRPGTSTPQAMVADNDYALGQIVEALSKTSFWRKMAIFVVEDDAQNGVDHVDGHRTVALVVSPFARRDWVDSTFYSNQSMVKTIELILGLPTLSLFDLIANDMRASFTETPDFAPYEAVRPAQRLDELNPPVSALRGEQRRAALDSSRMRWEVPDAVPTERLNRILWHTVRGWSTPYPGARRAVFAPLSIDIDDDDR